MTARKIRMGLVGGGEGAFIGAVHRMAARLDGQIELVCGALSGDPERALRSAQVLHLPAARSYADFHAMMRAERALPAGERMDFVAIATPNHLHLPVALAAIEHGFHVLSDKPATLNLDECRRLRTALRNADVLYGLTHTYAGYALVREARARVAAGELGAIRKILVDYAQGWLSFAEEEDAANKQAQWRVDPQRAGAGGCIGDIGVHAAQLVEYVSGLKITELCAELTSFVPGRALDDDSSMLLRFDNGARGILHASQICCGEENNLTLRIYGERGGLVWNQEEPNSLWLLQADRPKQLLRAGSAQLSADVQALARVPAGHPEGYIEAFANLYGDFVAAIRSVLNGTPVREAAAHMTGIDAGVRGMAFIEAAVASDAGAQRWVAVADA